MRLSASDCCLSYARQSPRSLGSYCQLKHDKSSSIPIKHQPASQEAALLSHVYPICQPKGRALPIRVSIDQECYLLGDKACGNLSNLIVELVEYYSECHMALLPFANNRRSQNHKFLSFCKISDDQKFHFVSFPNTRSERVTNTYT